MRSKTKIIVLHMKEVIYTTIFIILGIVLIFLLIYMFGPGQAPEGRQQPAETQSRCIHIFDCL